MHNISIYIMQFNMVAPDKVATYVYVTIMQCASGINI